MILSRGAIRTWLELKRCRSLIYALINFCHLSELCSNLIGQHLDWIRWMLNHSSTKFGAQTNMVKRPVLSLGDRIVQVRSHEARNIKYMTLAMCVHILWRQKYIRSQKVGPQPTSLSPLSPLPRQLSWFEIWQPI